MTTFKGRATEDSKPSTGGTGGPGKLTLAEILEIFAGSRLPIRFTAYDGSSAGPRRAVSAWS